MAVALVIYYEFNICVLLVFISFNWIFSSNVKTAVDNLTLLNERIHTFRLPDFTYSSRCFLPPPEATNKP